MKYLEAAFYLLVAAVGVVVAAIFLPIILVIDIIRGKNI